MFEIAFLRSFFARNLTVQLYLMYYITEFLDIFSLITVSLIYLNFERLAALKTSISIDINLDSNFFFNFHVSAPYVTVLFIIELYISNLIFLSISVPQYTIQHCCYCSTFINPLLNIILLSVLFIYFYRQILKLFIFSNATIIKFLISAPNTHLRAHICMKI